MDGGRQSIIRITLIGPPALHRLSKVQITVQEASFSLEGGVGQWELAPEYRCRPGRPRLSQPLSIGLGDSRHFRLIRPRYSYKHHARWRHRLLLLCSSTDYYEPWQVPVVLEGKFTSPEAIAGRIRARRRTNVKPTESE
jgi:hypothetical protein